MNSVLSLNGISMTLKKSAGHISYRYLCHYETSYNEHSFDFIYLHLKYDFTHQNLLLLLIVLKYRTMIEI